MQCHTIKIVQKLDIYNRFKNDRSAIRICSKPVSSLSVVHSYIIRVYRNTLWSELVPVFLVFAAAVDLLVNLLCVLQAKHLKFTFSLTKEDGSDEFEGNKLNRFAMQELAGNVCYVTFRPPEKASYLLIIYAKDSTDKV